MRKANLEEFIWVIRSAGERTVDICRQSILKLFPEAEIVIIEEVPFAAAVRKTLEIGLNSKKKWTVCLDADVILFDEGMEELLNKVVQNDSIFCHQALVLDKFLPIKRPAGIHVYSNLYNVKAIEEISTKSNPLRPESYMTMKMSAKGYLTLQTPFVIGVHDYGQNYLDIFKKAMLHANKHKEVMEVVEMYWNQMKEIDKDFEVAIYGALAGKLFSTNMKVDKNFWLEKTQKFLKDFDIQEKKELKISSKEFDLIEADFKKMKTDLKIQRYKNEYFRETFFRFQREPRIKNSINTVGLSFSNFLIKLGKRIN